MFKPGDILIYNRGTNKHWFGKKFKFRYTTNLEMLRVECLEELTNPPFLKGDLISINPERFDLYKNRKSHWPNWW